jgi:outer membrane lipoprotein-sorting protein
MRVTMNITSGARYCRSGFVFLLFLQLCSPCQLYAATPTVDEIISKTEHTAYYLGNDGSAHVKMTITDSQGRERKRRFSILRLDEQPEPQDQEASSGNQKYYLHIDYPSDLKNTVLLVWKHPGGDDDRWLYLPALDLAKRIAASDKRTSFLGSDYLYEDISGRGMDADTHELLETTKDYYVLKNIPRQADTVEFSEYTMWIHRQTFLPVKVEYLDKQGKKYRVYEALAVETIQGYPTITRSRMQDLALKQESTMEFSKVRYDRDLPEDIFTERYLRNPPNDLLR